MAQDLAKDDSSPKPFRIKTEHRAGYFEQEIITTSEGERHEKLERQFKNPAKVVLGRLSIAECSCYPYDFPDKVFWNVSGDKFQMDKYDVPKLMAINNKIKWFLNGGLQKSLKRESKSPLAIQIRLAYEYRASEVVGK